VTISCVRPLAVVLGLSLAGCGGEPPLARAPVSGAVFAQGQAVQSGVVRFVPIDGTAGPIASTAVDDGFYAFTSENGPVVGKHRVEVVATGYLGFDPGDEAAAKRALEATGGKLPASPVPAGYDRRSPLRADVPAGGVDGLDFLLTAKRSE